MTSKKSRLTRRDFSKGLLGSAAMLAGAPSMLAVGVKNTPAARFAYVARAEVVDVFDLRDGGFALAQTVAAERPVHATLHPSGKMLYVVHGTEAWEYLPRGAVSAYTVDPLRGSLTHVQSQALSLSATLPRHAVVSADGTRLVVAAAGGGIYNVLPLDADGYPGRAAGVLKEVGFSTECGVDKAAEPRCLAPLVDGSTFVAADTGAEVLTVFGLDAMQFSALHRRRVHAGEGPSQAVTSNDGRRIYALSAANGTISVHRFDEDVRQISTPEQHIATGGHSLMTMHAGGRWLVSAGEAGMAVWEVDEMNGRLSLATKTRSWGATVLVSERGRDSLIAFDAARGLAMRVDFRAERKAALRSTVLGQVDGVRSVALL